MPGRPRVVVVGGGTMGLASAVALARAGAEVTVLESLTPPHASGSHSGHTRVIRHAYHEGSNYVPLVREADDAWCALERETQQSLLVRTGLLEVGAPADHGFDAAVAACDAHQIPYQRLDSAEVRRRWPVRIPERWRASFTPCGGYLRVGPCFSALRTVATSLGVTFREGVAATVRRVLPGPRPVVELEEGTRLESDRVVVTAGVRTAKLLADASPPSIRAVRRVLFWISVPPAQRATFAALPVWAAFSPAGFFYGFPYGDEGTRGLKVACHTSTVHASLDQTIDPDRLQRKIEPRDWEPVADILKAHFEFPEPPHVAASCVCMYGLTPDWNFIVDRHPDSHAIIVAAGFSGHGFKFAPAIGKRVAELALGDSPPIEAFRYR